MGLLLTEARAVLSATFLGSPSEISATLPAARLAFHAWCSVTSVCGEVQGSKMSHVTHILPESILSPSWARCLAGLLSSTALMGAAGISPQVDTFSEAPVPSSHKRSPDTLCNC